MACRSPRRNDPEESCVSWCQTFSECWSAAPSEDGGEAVSGGWGTHPPEVEFVHPVSAGGSVKFLPAV